MSKPTLHPNHLDHLSAAQHMELWSEYAKIALSACLTFHGSDGDHENATSHVGQIADEMVAQHIERLLAFQDAKEVAREEEKVAKTKVKR